MDRPHWIPSRFALAGVLALIGAMASPVVAQTAYGHSAWSEHLACINEGKSPRDCAIETGFMDGDTYDRTMDMQDCMERGGDHSTCRVESGLASEDTISREQAAQQDLARYVTRLMHRISSRGDAVERLAALELAAALQPGPTSIESLVDRDAIRAWMANLSNGLEAELGHDPDLLAGLWRACQGHRCGGRAVLERIEQLEPDNLHWWNRSPRSLSEDTAAWLAAAAQATEFNERTWDAARRITRLLEAHPLPESLLVDPGDGPDFPPHMMAFATAFAIAGDVNVIRVGGGPLRGACREHGEDLRAECFAIGEVKATQGGTLNWRQVGAEMMMAAAWDDATRERAQYASDVIAWQLERQHEAAAMMGSGSATEELAFTRDVVLQDGATEMDLVQAYFARAGIPLEPPAGYSR